MNPTTSLPLQPPKRTSSKRSTPHDDCNPPNPDPATEKRQQKRKISNNEPMVEPATLKSFRGRDTLQEKTNLPSPAEASSRAEVPGSSMHKKSNNESLQESNSQAPRKTPKKKISALTELDDGRWHPTGSPDHACTHPTRQPDALPENALVIDRSCSILAHFGLYYLTPLQSIFCDSHSLLLSSKDILAHIMTNRHKTQRTGMDESHIHRAISHLIHSFSLPPEEDWPGLVSRVQNKELPCSELSGIHSRPERCQLCTGCHYWIKEGSSTPGKEKSAEWIQRHQNQERPMCFLARKKRYEDYRTAYTLQFMPAAKGKRIRPLKIVAAFQGEEREASCIDQMPASAVHDDTFPVHFKKLGWEDHLAANAFDHELARMLIRLPDTKHCPVPTSRKLWMTLDRGLKRVHKFLSQYLSDADQAIQKLHPLFREEITRREKGGKYRSLSPRSYTSYRRAPTMVIALVLHYILLSRIKSFHHKLDTIQLFWTDSQRAAFTNLFDFILSGASEKDQRGLEIRVHFVLITLLRERAPTSLRFGTLMDLVILFYSLRHGRSYLGPRELMSLLAAIQYAYRSTLIHAVRLGGWEKEYVPFESSEYFPFASSSGQDKDGEPPGDVNSEDMDDDSSGGNGDAFNDSVKNIFADSDDEGEEETYGDQEDEFGSDDELDESPADEDLDYDEAMPVPINLLESTTSTSDLQDVNLKFLHDNIEWITYKPKEEDVHLPPTAYQRMKATWLVIYPDGVTAMGKKTCTIASDGQSLQYCHIRRNGQAVNERIEIQTFSQAARGVHLHLEQHVAKYYKIARAGSPPVLDLHVIGDNPVKAESIFEQNSSIFGPLITDLWKYVQRLKPAEHQNLLKQEQNILESYVLFLFLTCGIPPRGFQAAATQYRSTNIRRRNLYIIDGSPVLAHPKAKQFASTYQASLWALPEKGASPLFLTLGVFRAISDKILLQLSASPLPSSDVYIFAQGKAPHGIRAWNDSKLCNVIAKATMPAFKTPLFPSDLRVIITAIFAWHFPELTRSSPGPRKEATTSLLNKTAGHTNLTEINNYGVSAHAKAVGISNSDIRDHMTVSRAFQTLVGVRPVEHGTRRYMETFAFFTSEEKRMMALDTARGLICPFYGIGGAAKRSITSSVVAKVLDSKPFLQAGTGGEASFGDEVLVKVTARMEYGYCAPDTLRGFPVGGYSIAVVAEALLMIIVALEEWLTGDYTRVKRLQDLEPELSQRREWVKKQIPHMGNTEWVNFSKRVHRSALQS